MKKLDLLKNYSVVNEILIEVVIARCVSQSTKPLA